MKIVGIAGTNGSGKDTVGQILQDEHEFLFVSVTDILRNEIIKRGQAPQREYLRALSAEWRKQYGLAVLIEKAIEIYDRAGGIHKGLAVSSLRNAGEADRIHELGGVVIWVDADPKIRYKRVISRQRSAEDDKTYEEFLAEEQDEMETSGDETHIASAKVKELADIFIENNYMDIESFENTLSQKLKII